MDSAEQVRILEAVFGWERVRLENGRDYLYVGESAPTWSRGEMEDIAIHFDRLEVPNRPGWYIPIGHVDISDNELAMTALILGLCEKYDCEFGQWYSKKHGGRWDACFTRSTTGSLGWARGTGRSATVLLAALQAVDGTGGSVDIGVRVSVRTDRLTAR